MFMDKDTAFFSSLLTVIFFFLSISQHGINVVTMSTHHISEPPSITKFYPDTGSTGNVITIRGDNFSANKTDNIVRFRTASAAILSATRTTITVVVPDNVTCGPISVTTPMGTVTSGTDFVVYTSYSFTVALQ